MFTKNNWEMQKCINAANILVYSYFGLTRYSASFSLLKTSTPSPHLIPGHRVEGPDRALVSCMMLGPCSPWHWCTFTLHEYLRVPRLVFLAEHWYTGCQWQHAQWPSSKGSWWSHWCLSWPCVCDQVQLLLCVKHILGLAVPLPSWVCVCLCEILHDYPLRSYFCSCNLLYCFHSPNNQRRKSLQGFSIKVHEQSCCYNYSFQLMQH